MALSGDLTAAERPATGLRRTGVTRIRVGMVYLLLFAVVATVAEWPDWPGDPNRLNAGDLSQMVWFLAYTPFAILHGHSLFSTDFLNYPAGVNLAQNTSSPLLGVLTAPLSYAVSPVASLSLLKWLGFVLSGMTMTLTLRVFVRNSACAFLGGLIYAFGPFVVCQSIDHLNLAFVPLPPLIFLATYELLRPEQPRGMRWGAALGVAIAAQIYISAEVALTSVVIVAIGVILAALRHPRAVPSALSGAWRGLLLAVVISLVTVFPLAEAMLQGHYRYSGQAYPGGVNADLLATIIPTDLIRLAPTAWRTKGSSLLDGNVTENGSYLGVPLLVLMVTFTAMFWRRRWVRFAGLMALICMLLSLGVVLTVDNHPTSFNVLPFKLISGLPVFNDIIASRFALYTTMFAAMLIALGCDSLLTCWRDRKQRPLSKRMQWGGSAVAVLTLVAMATIVPAWPEPSSPVDAPAYFSHDAKENIARNSVVLMLPYTGVANVAGMTYQAIAHIRFKSIGGYALVRGTNGTSTNFPAELKPLAVQRYLWYSSFGSAYPPGRIEKDGPRLRCETRTWLLQHHVGTVLYPYPPGAPPATATTLLDQVLGDATYQGGVLAWYGVPIKARVYHC